MSIDFPQNINVAHHANLLYKPSFWDPRKAYAWYKADLEGAFIEGLQFRQNRGKGYRTCTDLEKAGIANIAMLTDLQNDFRDGGRLPVLGTDDVVLRTAARLINGTVEDYYTGIVFSQDGHPDWHISYSAGWITEKGVPFDLRQNKAAILELEDPSMGLFNATCFSPVDGSPIKMGRIQRMINQKDSVAYWNHLQTTNQGPVWLFATHCKIGSDGVDSHPFLAEVLAFMAGARMIQTVPVFKGHLRDTDWFGPLMPCRPDPSHPQGGFRKDIVDLFEVVTGKGKVEFYGVAEDFCDYNMKLQVINHFRGTHFFDDMAFASDGTAPIVPHATHVLKLNEEAKNAGVHFFMTEDAFAA